ncbi:MAG: YeeE/YedE family protein, partial [candidate division Zixibacteria bacterium]|nr:YeeE/YedE family protein [candidate division Zixibacteria bacterium]
TPKEMMWVWPHFWLPAIIGGVVFGLGMVLSGGCVVGSLWRAGEGHIKLWASVVGMIIAMPLTAKYIAAPFYAALSPGMKQKVFLPGEIGYGLSILIFLGIILLWYLFVKWNERTGKFSAL